MRPVTVECGTAGCALRSGVGAPRGGEAAAMLRREPTPACPVPPLEVLRALFVAPNSLRPEQTAAQVVERAAAEFAKLSQSLRSRGADPERAARFLMRLLFCLFAEDIGLLP